MKNKLKTISYSDMVNALLEQLTEREAEVIAKRNALQSHPKHTLEKIGQDFSITRERVRQIENEGLKKIRGIDFSKSKIPVKTLDQVVAYFLDSHGGAMAEDHLVERLLEYKEAEQELNALYFILANIVSEYYERVKPASGFNTIWKQKKSQIDNLMDISKALHDLIESNEKPAAIDSVLSQFKDHDLYSHINDHESEDELMLEALLRLRAEIGQNILDEWGVKSWRSITPKRMTDKAYLVLRREGKPLHFEKITELINGAQFDRKRACPATVHNELILDDKYTLVGRGLYALKEDGYSEGTVADIITQILKDKGALDKKSIAEEVLKQRIVQKATITLALMKKDKFARQEDGTYILV